MKPLFTIEELREAIQNMDMSERGSDEEYGKVVLQEHLELQSVLLRRWDEWYLNF